MSTVATIVTSILLTQADLTPVEHALFAHGVGFALADDGVSLQFPPFTDIGALTVAWRLRPSRISAAHCTGADSFFAAMTPAQGMRLKQLRCTNSDITKLPSGLVALESLKVDGTNIDDFSVLAEMKALRLLDVSRCCITDADMALVAQHALLKELDVSYTGISEAGLRSIGSSRALRSVALVNCGVSDTNFQLLVNPAPESRLRSIKLGASLGGGLLKAEGFSSSGISKLSHAKLKRSGILVKGKPTPKRGLVVRASVVDAAGVISQVSLDWKAALSAEHLVALDLSGRQIKDSHVASLATIQSLRRVSVANTRVTDVALKSLAKMPGLRELDVSNTLVSDHGFWTYWQDTCRLSTLIADDARVIGVGLRADVFPELEVFSFRRTKTPRWPLTRLYPRCSQAAMRNLAGLDGLNRLTFSPSQSTWGMCAERMRHSPTLRRVDVWGITLTSEMRKLTGAGLVVRDDSQRGLGE